MPLGSELARIGRQRWRTAKPIELDPRLPAVLTGLGDIVLDEARLEELIPNKEIREKVLRKELLRGTVIPSRHKGFDVYHAPVRNLVFGRPVKSMNTMIQDILIKMDQINHPEKAKKLERLD